MQEWLTFLRTNAFPVMPCFQISGGEDKANQPTILSFLNYECVHLITMQNLCWDDTGQRKSGCVLKR